MVEANLEDQNMTAKKQKSLDNNQGGGATHSRPDSSQGLSPANPKLIHHSRSNCVETVRPLSGIGRAANESQIGKPGTKKGDMPEINVPRPRLGSINYNPLANSEREKLTSTASVMGVSRIGAGANKTRFGQP